MDGERISSEHLRIPFVTEVSRQFTGARRETIDQRINKSWPSVAHDFVFLGLVKSAARIQQDLPRTAAQKRLEGLFEPFEQKPFAEREDQDRAVLP